MAENSDIGTNIGTFVTVDVDANQVDSYRLIDAAGGMFRINGNLLEVSLVRFIIVLNTCTRRSFEKC